MSDAAASGDWIRHSHTLFREWISIILCNWLFVMIKQSFWPLLAGWLTLSAGCSGMADGTIPAADRYEGAEGAGGVSITWEERGRRAGAPTLVLIHGWNCDRRYWDPAMAVLEDDYHLVAVDLGGHGESGGDRQSWTIGAFGEDVAAVVRRLDLARVVLVGHSMGGPVAVEAAGRLPGRVVGVVGVDTFQAVEETPPDDLDRQLEPFRRDLGKALRRLDPLFFAPSTEPELEDWIRRDMAAAPVTVSVPALESLVRYDEAAALSALEVPVGTINADIRPTDAEALRRAQPGFELVIVEGAGHFLMMEQPERFARELRRLIDSWTAVMQRAAT